ncbi:hypothetical protein J4E91_002881 [Alternaria rosae]|nr:hypothetical protein J4E91_002881 [Alternaria rosae]
MTTASPAPVVRSRLSSSLIAERDVFEQDIINNNTAIARWAVSPRWNWRELRAARIVKRRFEREVTLLGIEIDIALERETRNMEWLGSLSQEELRARIDLAWGAVYSQ